MPGSVSGYKIVIWSSGQESAVSATSSFHMSGWVFADTDEAQDGDTLQPPLHELA